MSNPHLVSSFLDINTGGTPFDELALKVYGGQVLGAFNKATTTSGRRIERTIASGKSAQFPVLGRFPVASLVKNPGGAADAATLRGRELVFAQINSNEHVISIDGLLLAPLFLDILDEAKGHFSVRPEYATQQGQILAEADDKRSLAAMISGCRQAVAGFTGGDQTAPEIDAAMGTDVNILKAAIYGAAEQLDNFSVPNSDRYCWIPPSAFYLLLQDGEFIDRDFNDGSNGNRAMAIMRNAADFTIVKTNNLPRDDWSTETQLSTRLQDNYSADNLGVCAHASSSGCVTLIGLQFEAEYTMERQGTMLVAKYAKGYDYLRPEASVSLDLA
jgi:hypothetical protein